MGEPAMADDPHSNIDCSCRSLRDAPLQLRSNRCRSGRSGKSSHHQTAQICDWTCNLRWCASDGVERKKLDVSRSYLHRVGGSSSDSVDMATLRPAFRYAVQLLQE